MRRARTPDGVDVAVYDLGGSGPPVVLAHATGFHGHVWLPIVEVLSPSFHCYSFDERGHGDTPPRADLDFDWHGFATDLLTTVDLLALDEKPLAVGHSAGAAAIFLAEQERPGTFRAIYGYEPVVIPTDDPRPMPGRANPLAGGARRRREVFDSRDAAFENYAGKLPFSALAPQALRAYVDYGFDDLPDGTVRLKCRGENEARTYEMSSTHGAFTRLAEVRCPVTIACGADTDAFGPSIIETQASRLPDARTEVFAGLGHFGPLQAPTVVAEHIAKFFAGA